jgi:hypothetical protein
MFRFPRSLVMMLILMGQGFVDSSEQVQTMIERLTQSKHSQEPVAPYPYNEEEVTFVNKADGSWPPEVTGQLALLEIELHLNPDSLKAQVSLVSDRDGRNSIRTAEIEDVKELILVQPLRELIGSANAQAG